MYGMAVNIYDAVYFYLKILNPKEEDRLHSGRSFSKHCSKNHGNLKPRASLNYA